MPITLTLKNIPDPLYNQLKAVASTHHRSLNSEVIACLEAMLLPRRLTTNERLERASKLRSGLHPESVQQFIAHDIASAIREGRP